MGYVHRGLSCGGGCPSFSHLNYHEIRGLVFPNYLCQLLENVNVNELRLCQCHRPLSSRATLYFVDVQVDAIGGTRFDDGSGGDNEVQRTMLEIVNQLDGFDSRGNIKVCR